MYFLYIVCLIWPHCIFYMFVQPHTCIYAILEIVYILGGSLLDHSAEMSEIDARLNALQQFMKQSLETTSKTHSKR